MDGRAFLEPARELAGGETEAHRCSSAGRSYYALFQEAHASLLRWGFRGPARENVHAYVRLPFLSAPGREARRVGFGLERLVSLRNRADYQLAKSFRFG